MARVVQVGLVDDRGWVLLQERDSFAPVSPDQWTLPGGGIEPGESDAEAAARELAEETGLTDPLEPLGVHVVTCSVHGTDEVALFVARTAATDAHVVLGEGRQIVFVEPATVAGLDATDALSALLPVVLDAVGGSGIDS